MIITFCGHAQYTETKEDEQKILSFLEQKIGDEEAALYLGGYGAFDFFAQRCGRKYKQAHPNTKLVFVTPYLTPDYHKHRLDGQEDLYDEILYPPLENVPPKFAIARRNRWMVDKADCVIAHIRYGFGGAYRTYEYAKSKQKEIFRV